jgi:hypothetical protein
VSIINRGESYQSNRDKRSCCEINFNYIFGNSVQDILLALTHPISQLSEVYFIGRTLLLCEILLEDDLKVFDVGEDVVEGVADHQHGEGVVQLVPFLVRFVLKGFPQYSEDVDGRLAVRLFKGTFERLFLDFWTKGSYELGVYFFNLFQEALALVVEGAKLDAVLIDAFVNILIELLELLGGLILAPFQSWVCLV